MTFDDLYPCTQFNAALSSITEQPDGRLLVVVSPRLTPYEDSGLLKYNTACVRLLGTAGKLITFRVPTATFQAPMSASNIRWHVSEDDGLTWVPLSTRATGTGYVEFGNATAFVADTILVSREPTVSNALAHARIAALVGAYPSMLSIPTAVTLPTVIDERGVEHPPMTMPMVVLDDPAFTGPKNWMVLYHGQHAGEGSGSENAFQAFQLLPTNDPDALAIRAAYKVLLIGPVNSSREAGHLRGIFEEGEDPLYRYTDLNRHMHDVTLALVATIKAAVVSVTGGAVRLFFDFHETTGATGNPLYVAPSMLAQAQSFVSAMAPYFAMRADDNDEPGLASTWGMTLGAQFSATVERSWPTPSPTYASMTAQGVAVMRAVAALYAIPIVNNPPPPDLEARVDALETEVATIKTRLTAAGIP